MTQHTQAAPVSQPNTECPQVPTIIDDQFMKWLYVTRQKVTAGLRDIRKLVPILHGTPPPVVDHGHMCHDGSDASGCKLKATFL